MYAFILSLSACGMFAGRAPGVLVGRDLQLDEITLPDGFEISVFAEDVPNARSLTHGLPGIVFVGTRNDDRVYALRDADGDGVAEDVIRIARGLDTPNGVAWRDGSLYVAEISRVLRYDGLTERLAALPAGEDALDAPEPTVIRDDLPTEPHHGWKFIAFGPDDKLYVPIGAPCNVCASSDERFSSITRMNADGSDFEVFAHGIRNTVGFDWQPGTDTLWFTDNGRDQLGDDLPPDEINHAPTAGTHFGFPGCHGADLVDPELGDATSCEQTTAPQVELGPHVAALGMRFYDGDSFPSRFQGGIFHAEHGSWNRTDPIGYRVMFTPVDGDQAGPAEVFAEGWLKPAGAWGRPVDVLVMPDGALLVSDDKAGHIYRISASSPD